MTIIPVVDGDEAPSSATIDLLNPAAFICESFRLADAYLEPTCTGPSCPDAAELDPIRCSATLRTRLVCTWHREPGGRLLCRWRQVSAVELGALTIEPPCSSTDDPSSWPLRQEPRVQAIVRWFAIATLLASAGLSSIVCLLGG